MRRRERAVRAVTALLRTRYGGTDFDLGLIDAATWKELITLASAQAVLPALAAALRNAPGGLEAAGDAGVFLSEMENANRQRNGRLKDRLLEIGTALHTAGIPAVALKGAAFLLDNPDGAAWRFSHDLDILVPASEVESAVKLLTDLCYDEPGLPYRPADLHHYPALVHADGETVVEIHSRLAPQEGFPLLPPERVLNEAEPALSETPLKVPSRDDRLIHLIAHAQCFSLRHKRRILLLRDICDLMELTVKRRDAQTTDWQPIRARFAAAGLEPEVAGFLAAAELVLAPLFQAPPWAEAGRSWAKQSLSGLSGRWSIRLRFAAERLAYFGRELALNPHRRRRAWATLTDAQLRRNFIDHIAAQWRNIR